jgi:hypothetical protein
VEESPDGKMLRELESWSVSPVLDNMDTTELDKKPMRKVEEVVEGEPAEKRKKRGTGETNPVVTGDIAVPIAKTQALIDLESLDTTKCVSRVEFHDVAANLVKKAVFYERLQYKNLVTEKPDMISKYPDFPMLRIGDILTKYAEKVRDFEMVLTMRPDDRVRQNVAEGRKYIQRKTAAGLDGQVQIRFG